MLTAIKKIEKTDRLFLILLTGLFLFITIITWAKWGHPIVDCFRNAYVPAEILKGKVLYKDVFYFYGPLAPYFNALLFSVFGVKLEVLYWVGILLSLCFVLGVYYLARQLLEPFNAFVILLVMLIQTFFRPGIFQFIFPYSSDAAYGSFMLLLLLICLVRFIKNHYENLIFLKVATLIVIITIFIKQDVALSACLTFYIFSAVLLLFKKLHFKDVYIFLIAPLLLAPLIYLLIGAFIPLNYLLNGLLPLDIFSPYYIENYSGSTIGAGYFKHALQFFITTMGSILVATFIVYGFILLGKKTFKPFNWQWVGISLVILSAIYLIGGYFKKELFITYLFELNFWTGHVIYQWMVIFLVVYLISTINYIIWKKKTMNVKYAILLLYTGSAIAFLFRSLVAVNLQSFNNFYLYTGVIIFFYFVYKNIPAAISGINKKYYMAALSSVLIVITIQTGWHFYDVYQFKNIQIKTDRGLFYASPLRGLQIQAAINYILQVTNQKDTIFAAPEESILYFMTGRSGASRYYQLLPGIVDKMTVENEIIDNLKKYRPAMIFISNNDVVPLYGKQQWGYDYDKDVYKWIIQQYFFKDQIRIINSDTNKLLFPYVINIYLPRHKK